MKTACFLIGVALLAAVNTFAEDVPENLLLEVQSDVEAMKKKGATEADCKDLAKTTCKEVKSDNGASQKTIDSQSSGAECTKLGQKTVVTVVTRYQKLVTRWKESKTTITKLSNAKVTISSRRFKTLKTGKCGFVFTSRSYLSARAKYNRAVNVERTLRGKVSEAKKAIAIAKKTQKNMQEKCRCGVVNRRDTLWKTLNNSPKRAKAAKALAKCKMMQCVLAGTPVTNKKCKGVLPKLRNKTLDRLTEHAFSSRICHRRHLITLAQIKKKEIASKAARKERKGKAIRKERKAKAIREERKAKAARKEQQAKAKAREQKKKHHEKRSKAAEKLSKERSRKIKEKAGKERKGKAQKRAFRARNTCTVTAYQHSGYRGAVVQRSSYCGTSTNVRFSPRGRRRGFSASSFRLSSGCKKVQLWDEDACRYNYRDNVNIHSSTSSVKWDLNDDICGITIWSKAGRGC